ncbi:selT/selW/selH selenoprotein domain-containing protein [Diaporthe helianthi]|uniref:SelT/selW/selH selenoprotein domain-containing protein n=1 Tax=Diaporthe helianthi TaxID=158607 RepID=A0A2P5I1D1_DIAHE|nr:selT/selW/selH selenoprotein domain-containing protein [Diaporthe helianthi]
MADGVDTGAPFPLPRVTIKFCTQCKWMLRAAYYAQELLSTFSTSLGEVALQPSTGGTFVVEIFHSLPTSQTPQPESRSGSGDDGAVSPARRVLWDRKTDGGFPETKELKRRVRDVIEPGRDLGHVDRNHARPGASTTTTTNTTSSTATTSEPAKAGTTEAQQQQPQKDKPSRAELEAAGTAGAGYPGASEATAEATPAAAAAAACENKRECEDCD